MRNVYRVLAFLLAIEVVVQAMAVAYGIAGLTHWVDEDGGVLNKAVFESDDPDFSGIGGFITHGINGMMIIPLIVLLLLIVSFFAKVPGGVQKAAILLGLVVLQVFLGIFSHSIPFVVVLHVLNAFAILGTALAAGRSTMVVQETAQPSVAV
jgi:cytochrome bd-type quinol oxidase subunit 2